MGLKKVLIFLCNFFQIGFEEIFSFRKYEIELLFYLDRIQVDCLRQFVSRQIFDTETRNLKIHKVAKQRILKLMKARNKDFVIKQIKMFSADTISIWKQKVNATQITEQTTKTIAKSLYQSHSEAYSSTSRNRFSSG